MSSKIVFHLIEIRVVRHKLYSPHQHCILLFPQHGVDLRSDKHIKEFRQFVLTLHRRRDSQHIWCDRLQQSLGELLATNSVYLINDRQSELRVHFLRKHLVIHGLDHTNHNILVLYIACGRLDFSHSRPRQEFLYTLYPLIHQEFFMDQDECLLLYQRHDLERHNRIVRYREVAENKPAITVNFKSIVIVLFQCGHFDGVKVGCSMFQTCSALDPKVIAFHRNFSDIITINPYNHLVTTRRRVTSVYNANSCTEPKRPRQCEDILR